MTDFFFMYYLLPFPLQELEEDSIKFECGAQMCVIAIIQDKPVIYKLLGSVGEATEPPSLSAARGSRAGMIMTRICLLMKMEHPIPNMSSINVFSGENE